MKINFKYNLFWLFISILLFLYSCSHVNQANTNINLKNLKNFKDLKTQNFFEKLEKINNQNKDLKSFKGLGKIKLKKDDTYQNSRIAWIGENSKQESQIRIEFLNLIGGSTQVMFCFDKNYFYFKNYLDNKLEKKKINSESVNLKDILGVSIKLKDINSLLTGLIPIVNFHNAYVNNDLELILESKSGNILEKIHFGKIDKDKTENFVEKIEMFNPDGSFSYQVKLANFQIIQDKYKVPFKLAFSNKKSNFEINIQNYWADFEIKTNIFTIN